MLEFENLRDVVLCGASYGGMPVTGAADRTTERIALVIYIDALVPLAGQSALDLLPEAFGDYVRSGVGQHGPNWRVPLSQDLSEALFPSGSLPDQVRADYFARVRDQPAAAFIEPLPLTGAVEHLRRAFVRCTTGLMAARLGEDPIEACARRARTDGWTYRELAAAHDPQVFDPAGIATMLDEISAL